MSIPAKLAEDPLKRSIDEVEASLGKLKKSLEEDPLPCGSRVLALAIQAGLPPQMTYTVSQTARYLDIDQGVLREENRKGRLRLVRAKDKDRGSRVPVDEVDRWIEEGTHGRED